MATIIVTKGWIEKYFGIKIDRPEQYSSYWQTDGGTATQDFDRLPEDEYELVHRSSSKTYWGKYVHPTVPPPPYGAEQHTQTRTATYGDADRYKEQIIAGWKAGGQIGEDSTAKSQDYFWEKESREAGFIVGKKVEILVDDKDFVHAPAMYKAGDTGEIVRIGASSAGWTVEVKLDYPRGKGREGKIHHRIFLPNQVKPTKERLLVRDDGKNILIKEEEISNLEGIVRAYYSDIQKPIAERHYSVPYPNQTANAKYEAIHKLWSDINFYLGEKRVSHHEDASGVREKPDDPDFGRDYRIDVKGLILIPSMSSPPTILYITEQDKWDANISPTVPSNYQPRYWKSLLVTEQSPEYINNKEEFKHWKLLKDNVAGIVKRHESDIPKGALPQVSAGVLKTGYKVEDELSPEANRITGVGIYFGRGIYNTYIVSENTHHSDRFNRDIIRYSISEMGSSFVEKLLNRYPNRAFIESFYNSISNLVNTYQVLLLGREGLQAYHATAEDRRLVDALSHGAKMDEEGYIVDPITGDRF